MTLRVPDCWKGLHRHEGGYLLTLDNDDELAVKLVVGADGANSQVRADGRHWDPCLQCRANLHADHRAVGNAPAKAPGSICRTAPACILTAV